MPGLDDRVDVLLQDYRELSGTFDKIISIEMIEAIGYRQYPTFFKSRMNLLGDTRLWLPYSGDYHRRSGIRAREAPCGLY